MEFMLICKMRGTSTGGGGRGGRGPGLGEIPEMRRRARMSRRLKMEDERERQYERGVTILANGGALDEKRDDESVEGR